jgi:hypothetical protein
MKSTVFWDMALYVKFKSQPTFRRNISLPASWSKSKLSKKTQRERERSCGMPSQQSRGDNVPPKRWLAFPEDITIFNKVSGSWT